MWRMSTAWCRSTSSPVCRSRSRNWRKFSCIYDSPQPEGESCWRAFAKLLRLVPGGNNDGRGRTIKVNANRTMKALVLRKHGGPEDVDVVDDHRWPTPADAHVAIRSRPSSSTYPSVFP